VGWGILLFLDLGGWVFLRNFCEICGGGYFEMLLKRCDDDLGTLCISGSSRENPKMDSKSAQELFVFHEYVHRTKF